MKALTLVILFAASQAAAAENVSLSFSEERGLTPSEACISELLLQELGLANVVVYHSPFMLTSPDRVEAYHAVYIGDPVAVATYQLVFSSLARDGWYRFHVVQPVHTEIMSDQVLVKWGEENVARLNVASCF